MDFLDIEKAVELLDGIDRFSVQGKDIYLDSKAFFSLVGELGIEFHKVGNSIKVSFVRRGYRYHALASREEVKNHLNNIF